VDLDKAVEAYVGSITDTPCQRSHFDFEVSDATAKLEDMGLLVKPPALSQSGKDPVLGVLPLPEAVQLLDIANYKTPDQGTILNAEDQQGAVQGTEDLTGIGAARLAM
jgi:hypothetical protein